MKQESVRVASRGRSLHQSQCGLTLPELMVAMAIGLVLALAVALSTLSMGRQFRIVGASSAADVNAQVALSLMDDAGRSAGAGLYNDGKPLCPTINIWRDGTTVSNGGVFMPARITDGGGASDTIVFTGVRVAGALTALPVIDAMASADDAIVVNASGGISNGDVAIVGVPGDTAVPCTMFRVTAAPTVAASCGGNAASCVTLQRTGGSTGLNPISAAGAFTTAPRYGFAAAAPVVGPAVVQRLGSDVRQDGFQVLCGALVQYNAFSDTPACTSAVAFSGGANAVVSDVVVMHAQYGISNTASSDIVTNWVNATGTWANPTAADAGRVKAVRVVVVVRSKEPDNEQVTAATCINSGGVSNSGPCSFDDASAPVIDVSGVAVPAGRNWRNYRYRVHQAVIPLRSVIWSS
jgi:type IV pilus assembly protein PilW